MHAASALRRSPPIYPRSHGDRPFDLGNEDKVVHQAAAAACPSGDLPCWHVECFAVCALFVAGHFVFLNIAVVDSPKTPLRPLMLTN